MAEKDPTPKEEVLNCLAQVRLLVSETKPLTALQRLQARSYLDFAEEMVQARLTVARPRKEATT